MIYQLQSMIKALANGNVEPGGIMDLFLRQFELLEAQIQELRRDVDSLRNGSVPTKRTMTPEEFKALFQKSEVMRRQFWDPVQGKETTAEVSDAQLVNSIFGEELMEEEKTDESHPAANSSFVLKI